MRKKETPNPSRVRGRGVEVSETLFYHIGGQISQNPWQKWREYEKN